MGQSPPVVSSPQPSTQAASGFGILIARQSAWLLMLPWRHWWRPSVPKVRSDGRCSNNAATAGSTSRTYQGVLMMRSERERAHSGKCSWRLPCRPSFARWRWQASRRGDASTAQVVVASSSDGARWAPTNCARTEQTLSKQHCMASQLRRYRREVAEGPPQARRAQSRVCDGAGARCSPCHHQCLRRQLANHQGRGKWLQTCAGVLLLEPS